VYESLKAEQNKPFEVVYISRDFVVEGGEEKYNNFFGTMPWLGIPYKDIDTMQMLSKEYSVTTVPKLIILDEAGKVNNIEAVTLVRKKGAAAYPFKCNHKQWAPAQLARLPKSLAGAHEHTLKYVKFRSYECYTCEKSCLGASYNCRECDVDINPACVM